MIVVSSLFELPGVPPHPGHPVPPVRLVFTSLCLVFATATPLKRSATDPPAARLTCRELAADPTAYAGRVVDLSTAGVQPGDAGGVLVYRRTATGRPVVVIRLRPPIPTQTPATVRGVVAAGSPPVVVADARPR